MTTFDITYRVRPGYHLSPKDAAVIGPELRRILEARGSLTPKAMLIEATPKSAPLHRYVFDVGPQLAAERYYLHRCNYIAKAITVGVETEDGTAALPAFYSVAMTDDEQDREYLPVQDVLTDANLVQREFARFTRDIKRIKDEYDLMRRAHVFEKKAGHVLVAIDKALEEAR